MNGNTISDGTQIINIINDIYLLFLIHRQKCESTRQGRSSDQRARRARVRWTITTLGKKLNLKIKIPFRIS
jgi:hypothetical protein